VTTYRPTTVYLTGEQVSWLRRFSAQATLDGLTLSHADVVRLALTRLRNQLVDNDLRVALIEHVQAEALENPGRVKRGMPQMAAPAS